MTMFWIVAGLFLLGALLLLLPGLLSPHAAADAGSAASASIAVHRDQWREAEADLANGLLSPARFAQARSEIQQRVLADADRAVPGAPARPARPARRTAWALALLIPLGTVLTYLQLGDLQALAPTVAPADRHSVTPEQIQKMVATLGERLKNAPDDAEGWLMLGRSYTALARYHDGATALRRAAALLPGNASVLADLADVLGMAQNRRLAGEPARLVQQALDLDPRHVKALALAGSVAFEAKDYGAARGYWQRLLGLVPVDSAMARSVQGSVAQATQLEAAGPAGAPQRRQVAAGAAADSAAGASSPADRAGVVSGQVLVSAALAARVAAGDTLFIFARAAQGPRMPLAIVRETVRKPAAGLPLDFRLDDAMAMSPELKLSNFAQVVVGARISRSGNATPQPGDLFGHSATLSPGAQGVRVVLDQVQP